MSSFKHNLVMILGIGIGIMGGHILIRSLFRNNSNKKINYQNHTTNNFNKTQFNTANNFQNQHSKTNNIYDNISEGLSSSSNKKI